MTKKPLEFLTYINSFTLIYMIKCKLINTKIDFQKQDKRSRNSEPSRITK
jgi:hypothetical protein